MDIYLKRLMFPSIVALISAVVFLGIRSVAFKYLNKWAERTETRIDDIILKSLRTPSL